MFEDLVVVVTGGRPASLGCDPDPRTWTPAMQYIKDVVRHYRVLVKGRLIVVTGVAEGFDLMVAGGVLLAKDEGVAVELISAVPFAGDTEGFVHKTSVRYHDRVLERSDEVHVISEVPWSYEPRNLWMTMQPQSRGMAGVGWSAWNGAYKGGTYQTRRMMFDAKLPVDNSFYRLVREQLGVS